MAVYLGLVNLDNASASASASAAIPLPLAANALPVVAAKKKGLFWGGRKTRRRNTKRSKKTRGKRRQTRYRR